MISRFIFTVSVLFVATNTFLIEDATESFNLFKLKYAKTYKDQLEEQKRFSIFKENLQTIEQHNELYQNGLSSFTMGINKFTDLTTEEFQERLVTPPKLEKSKFKSVCSLHYSVGVNPPESIDWREKGVVSNVKDQKDCKAEWAFSVTGAIEAANAIKMGTRVKTPTLSEQQLIDCTRNYFNNGCRGGFIENTYSYLLEYGLQTEESYRYIDADGFCVYDSDKVAVRIGSYKIINGKENDLLEAVGTIGPVSVIIDGSFLQHYSNGIFNGNCTEIAFDSAALAVGYGSENDTDYWILKNSWGKNWGENGYFRILRGSNKCGISQDRVYPVLSE